MLPLWEGKKIGNCIAEEEEVPVYIKQFGDSVEEIFVTAPELKRKFALEYITRDDIAALTKEAAEISGIDYVMDADEEEVDRILSG